MTNVIVVHLDEALTVFETRGKELKIAPVLYVAIGEPRGRGLSVGEPCPDGVATHRVAVLSDEPPPLAPTTLMQCTETFFRYGYQKVTSPSALLAPIVVLVSPRNGAVLSPECVERLSNAAGSAGASEVYWGSERFQEHYGVSPREALGRAAASSPSR